MGNTSLFGKIQLPYRKFMGQVYDDIDIDDQLYQETGLRHPQDVTPMKNDRQRKIGIS